MSWFIPFLLCEFTHLQPLSRCVLISIPLPIASPSPHIVLSAAGLCLIALRFTCTYSFFPSFPYFSAYFWPSFSNLFCFSLFFYYLFLYFFRLESFFCQWLMSTGFSGSSSFISLLPSFRNAIFLVHCYWKINIFRNNSIFSDYINVKWLQTDAGMKHSGMIFIQYFKSHNQIW